MTHVRIRFRPEARAEILEARRWYEAQVRGLGRAFLAEFDAVIELVRVFPRMHRVITEDGEVHRALLRRFPFSLVYETLGDHEIVVLACRHIRQDEVDWSTERREG
ncbi:MAG TPA: type II toxin-antitoxin system RelE/ParE family toxin [Gemmatimonadaceae bacterium]|nr:type II toxin-antitoxin system RelE/ParE family toxin [Gemmatimonadaceae bacterium]